MMCADYWRLRSRPVVGLCSDGLSLNVGSLPAASAALLLPVTLNRQLQQARPHPTHISGTERNDENDLHNSRDGRSACRRLRSRYKRAGHSPVHKDQHDVKAIIICFYLTTTSFFAGVSPGFDVSP